MKIKILVLNINDIGGIERVAFNMLEMFKKDRLLSNVEIVSINGESDCSDIKVLTGQDENRKLFYFSKSLDSDTLVLSLYDRFSIKLSFIRGLLKSDFKLYACQHADYFAHRMSTRLLRRIFYCGVDKIIALTNTDSDLYKKHFSKVYTIPNVLGYYPDNALKHNDRHIDCAAAGRLVPIKQYDHYYHLLSVINPLKENQSFKLYGDGPESKTLSDLLTSKGMVPEIIQVGTTENIYVELNNTKFFFVTSLRESFSMVILEAMACGCVVISYDCPTGPRELIQHGINGYLVQANDISGLANCYKELFENPEMCQEISNNARFTALKYVESNILKIWKGICE
ncbi:glycosyltransferase [Vibrio cyclitrophicus]|uniref:glycosyltransferase n=1 Tax=Vibrio cyclitrophicus TaxID=47951 RepID=UPI00030BD925|nr:glycosyltransferase [Vibrio cyclitrophicus]OEF42867.1 hypothetical protein OAE_00050 [Vibrio cyclitrophicus 1F289]PMF16211.1 hypothetical protein BCV20_05560 [Vibrio cyclitrophicus]